MATINSVQIGKGLAVPSVPLDAHESSGVERIKVATFTNVAGVVNGTTHTATDLFNCFTIPKGTRIVGFTIGLSGAATTQQLSIGHAAIGATAANAVAYKVAAVIVPGSNVVLLTQGVYDPAGFLGGATPLPNDVTITMTNSVATMTAGVTIILICRYVCD